ncbi:MAG: bifunctional folylpolyglutamate synthase/dihydrofolate synthase [Candidatus Dormibacteria bacterium]
MAYRDSLVRLAETSQSGMRLGLDTTRALLAELGNPHEGLRGVLVAGTNGKGSVCAMVAEAGRQAGHRVVLLTKPHLTSYRERIQLGARPVSEGEFATLANAVADAAGRLGPGSGRPTHHELLTAMGFLAARRHRSDLVVCEVGLGGRLDASNVWDGGVSAIVSIGLDHQDQLGTTLAAIAGEKAGIIKPGQWVLSGARGEARRVIERAAARAGACLWELDSEITWRPSEHGTINVRTPLGLWQRLRVALSGRHQADNAALAVAICDALGQAGIPITEAALRQGLASVRWPGRLQLLASAPPVLVDAAHNPDAVAAVLPELEERLRGRRGVLLFGSMDDHDHRGMLRLLSQVGFSETVFTRAESARAAPADSLRTGWPGPGRVIPEVPPALAEARKLAGPQGLVVSLGSIYVIGEVMAALGEGLVPDPEIPESAMW